MTKFTTKEKELAKKYDVSSKNALYIDLTEALWDYEEPEVLQVIEDIFVKLHAMNDDDFELNMSA